MRASRVLQNSQGKLSASYISVDVLFRRDIVMCAECYRRVSRIGLQRDRGFQNDSKILVVHCAYCHWTDELRKYQVSDFYLR